MGGFRIVMFLFDSGIFSKTNGALIFGHGLTELARLGVVHQYYVLAMTGRVPRCLELEPGRSGRIPSGEDRRVTHSCARWRCPARPARQPNLKSARRKSPLKSVLDQERRRERVCPPFLMRRMHCMRPYHQVGGRGSLTRYRT